MGEINPTPTANNYISRLWYECADLLMDISYKVECFKLQESINQLFWNWLKISIKMQTNTTILQGHFGDNAISSSLFTKCR